MSRKLVLLCLFGAAVAETPVAYDNPAAGVDPNYYQGELSVCHAGANVQRMNGESA